MTLTIESYINSLPKDRKESVHKIINVVEENIPVGYAKIMNYSMPSFVIPHSIYPAGYHVTPDLPLPFIGVASQKNHIGFYHMGLYADSKLLDWFISEYPKYCKSKLDMGKSCIRFKKMDNIPYFLIAELSTRMTTQDWISIYEKNIKL
jgi:hypothetical protein